MVQLIKQLGGQVKVQHLSDHLRPAVHEIQPAILHENLAAFHLRQRLVHEIQFTAVIELPGDTFSGNLPSQVIGEPGVSLPMPVALMIT